MKTIENKSTKILKTAEVEGKPAEYINYADLIKIALGTPVPGGYSYEDNVNRNKIFEEANDNKPFLDIEDSYFTYLKTLLNPKTIRFPILHQDIVGFIDDIQAIK